MLQTSIPKIYSVKHNKLRDVSDNAVLFEIATTKASDGAACFIGNEASGRSEKVGERLGYFSTSNRGDELTITTLIHDGGVAVGFIDDLRARLTVGQRYLIQGQTLRTDIESTINPFDTQLGLSYLLPTAHKHLIAFLHKLLIPSVEDMGGQAILGADGLLTSLVNDVYRLTLGAPDTASLRKNYVKGYYSDLDELIEEHQVFDGNEAIAAIDLAARFHLLSCEISDEYNHNNLCFARDLAHRLAMPTLKDLLVVLNNGDYLDIYRNTVYTGESLAVFIRRRIGDAINDYPIFANPTHFEISQSNVTAIDMQEVFAEHHPSAHALFVIAIHKLATDKISKVALDAGLHGYEIDPTYIAYHNRQTNYISNNKALVAFDGIDLTEHTDLLSAVQRSQINFGVTYLFSVDSLMDLVADDGDCELLSDVTALHFFSEPTKQDLQIFKRFFTRNRTILDDLNKVDDEVYMSCVLIVAPDDGLLIKTALCNKESIIDTVKKRLGNM